MLILLLILLIISFGLAFISVIIEREPTIIAGCAGYMLGGFAAAIMYELSKML